MTRTEFQAVVLAAGRGSRFPDLIGSRPKCLLPIGPFPMVFYPLHMLQTHGFHEIIVVVLESERSEIQQALERSPLKAKLDFATIPDSEFGTADSLKHIKDRINCDLVVVSCDTVTNIDLFAMLNCFRQNNASVVAQLFKAGLEADTVMPGPKMKHKIDRDLIGIQPKTQRLTFMASTSDYDEELNLSYHLLHHYGNIVMHSRMIDSHIYVIKKWIIDFLNQNDGFSALKGELIPYIVKKQMARPKIHTSDTDKVTLSVVNVNFKEDDIFNCISHSDLEEKITETSLYNESDNRSPFNGDIIRCYALHPQENCFGIRVNTLLSYCTINQKLFDLWEKIFRTPNTPSLVSAQSNVKSTQIANCAIADHAIISEKTSLKDTIVGVGSKVNPKTRISNSVLMNGVVIHEGVVIENCVICDKAIINSGCVLKNCLVGPSHEVAENTTKEKAHLTNSDVFMEIE